MLELANTLGCHVNPFTAATAVSVAGYPWQTMVGLTEAETESGVIVMVVVATVVPQPFCPVTVYTAELVGVNVCPFTTPALVQVYVMAPVAVNETVLPRQMLLLGLDIERTGEPELTITLITPVAVQFIELVPTTV